MIYILCVQPRLLDTVPVLVSELLLLFVLPRGLDDGLIFPSNKNKKNFLISLYYYLGIVTTEMCLVNRSQI